MEIEHCDICGRKCDGVHSSKINNKEKEIQKLQTCLKVMAKKWLMKS
jgi:hypothetical protein